jgi:hypothetical protein
MRWHRRAGTTALIVALVGVALTGCAAGPTPYKWDASLNNLPTVAVDEGRIDLLPAALDYHVVTVVHAKDGLVVALAIHDGHCFVTFSGPGNNDMGIGADAPRGAINDTDDQEWTGERKVIGPNGTVSADILPGKPSKIYSERNDILLACGTRGAWLSVPLPARELTISGTVSLPPSAQGPAKTGIVVTG